MSVKRKLTNSELVASYRDECDKLTLLLDTEEEKKIASRRIRLLHELGESPTTSSRNEQSEG